MEHQLTHPERIAVARLHALLELLPTALDKRLGAAGITSFEYTLLDVLSQNSENRMRLSEVARKTNATLPRISRVASSLERRGLIERSPCPSDKRATNAVVTAAGAATYSAAQEAYALAVRELILEGLTLLPGDGVAQLTDLTYAMLTSLDPNHPRFAAEAEASCSADPDEATTPCEADPAVSGPAAPCSADPEPPTVPCAADPAPASTQCAADPAFMPCAADPAPVLCAADPA